MADLEGNKDEQHPEVLAQTPVLPPTDDPNYIPNAYPRLSLEEASETDSQSSLDDEDGVDRYWKSDHHRFEWPDVSVRQRSPLSWHSLGLPVQDSFIAKGRALCQRLVTVYCYIYCYYISFAYSEKADILFQSKRMDKDFIHII